MKSNTLILITLAGLLLNGCQLNPTSHSERAAIAVKVAEMDAQTITSTHSYVATIEENGAVPMSIVRGGTICEIAVKNGQRVRAGQLLLRVDATQATNALQAAKAALAQAEDGYERSQALFEKGITTDVQRIEIETKLQEAQSMAAVAQKNVDDCVLRAPLDGIVSGLELNVGQNLLPGQRAMTILNIDRYMVGFSVPESEIAQIKTGEKGRLAVRAINEDSIAISVAELGVVANQLTHTYPVKAYIEMKNAASCGLRPGMVGQLYLNSMSENGFLLPGNCIQLLASGPSVWIVENGQAIRKSISVGKAARDGVMVTAGLQKGDIVVTEGYQKLYNGAKVTY